MIQRIQTLLLSLSTIILGILLLFDIADLSFNNELYTLNWKALIQTSTKKIISPNSPLLILLIVCMLTQTTCIFLFKNRNLQIRICVYTIILLLGLMGLTAFYFLQAKSGLSEIKGFTLDYYQLKITGILPLVSAFLNYLALRKILKDELLVKSVDRLR